MKLHINAVPVVIALFFLGLVIGARENAVLVTPIDLQIDRDISKARSTKPASVLTAVGSIGDGQGSLDSLLSFPGCEGDGCGALQQYRTNGYRKIYVTTLSNADEPGSTRRAFRTVQEDSSKVNKQLDFIIPKVAGYVNGMIGSFDFNLRGLYFMGQIAPGPFVLGRNRFQIDHSEDVVIRSVGFRGQQGSINGNFVGYGSGVHRLVYDHISVAMGGERMFFASVDTVRQSITGEPACSKYLSFTHSAFTFKGNLANEGSGLDEAFDFGDSATLFATGAWPRQQQCNNYITFAHNLIGSGQGHSNTWRHPNTSGFFHLIHQNYQYNRGQSGMGAHHYFHTDYVYNYWKWGPNTSGSPSSREYYPINASTDVPSELSFCEDDVYSLGCDMADRRIYIQKNHSSRNGADWSDTADTHDQVWRGGVDERMIAKYRYDSVSAPIQYKSLTPLHPDFFPIDTLPMSEATFDGLLDDVGSQLKVDNEGKFISVPDSVDREAFRTVRAGTNTNMPGTVHRDSFRILFFPPFADDAFTPYADADNDDLPDAFELLCTGGVSTTSLDWDADISGDGYINLEEYANGTNFGDRVLTWTDKSEGELGFRVYRNSQFLGGLPSDLIGTVGPNVTTFTDPTSWIGAAYWIRAYDASGTSTPSNTAISKCR